MRATGAIVLASAVLAGAWPAAAEGGDAERGRAIFNRCYACHTAYRSERGEHGLSLWRVIGRRAAAVRGFDYSPAMRRLARAGFVWTEAALDRFLSDPAATVPGTSMPFGGLRDARERADLIAFLKRAEIAPPRRAK
jgi:cytochrome c